MRDLSVRVGDVGLHLMAMPDCPDLLAAQDYQPFVVAQNGGSISLRVHSGRLPGYPAGASVFDSGGLWRVFRSGTGYVIALTMFGDASRPFALAFLDASLTEGDLYLGEPDRERLARAVADGHVPAAVLSQACSGTVDPLPYPLVEVLVIHHLAQRQGIILHAFGLDDAGQGIIFCGVSGAGKSTTARLWQDAGVKRLSDDRIIVRKQGEDLWMYGTPWHGDAGVADPSRAPLRKVFFLAKSPGHYVRALPPQDVVGRLLVRCFPPFYDATGMEGVLALLSDIAGRVPCYELGFTPDPSVVEFVRSQA